MKEYDNKFVFFDFWCERYEIIRDTVKSWCYRAGNKNLITVSTTEGYYYLRECDKERFLDWYNKEA